MLRRRPRRLACATSRFSWHADDAILPLHNLPAGSAKGTHLERKDGRRPDQMRPLRINPGYLPHAEGSALIELGGTVVLCAVSAEDRVPLGVYARTTSTTLMPR